MQKKQQIATPVSPIAEALLRTYRTNHDCNRTVITNIAKPVWSLNPPSGGRTIAAIVSHMHSVRTSWLKAATQGETALAVLDPESVTPQQAVKALDESYAALDRVLRSALEADGKVKGFGGDPVSFLAYLIAHDAHHRGQISMLARQLAHPLPKEVMYGIWKWGR